MSASVGLLDMMGDKQLLGPFFSGPSWSNWRVTLKAMLGEPMTARERKRFHALAGRDPPTVRVREAWYAVGRRGGKDSIASAIAVHAAVFGQFEKNVRPGERPVVLLLASTKEQAGGLLQYIRGLFAEVALLRPLVRRITGGTIELTTGVDIVVAASDYRSIRGRTVAVAIFNEIGFWKDASGYYTSPDIEVYSAVVPSLMTLRRAGSMLIGISSVHRKLGLLYDRVTSFEGKDDPDVLAIRAPSTTYNPTLDPVDIAADIKLDPERGRAEWYSEWRADISDFVDRATVEALIDVGVHERNYDPSVRGGYIAFCDQAGGSGQDSAALSIVHIEAGLIIQDLARRWAPPFNPSDTIAEQARLLKQFKLSAVSGDSWGGGVVPDLFRRNGIRYLEAPKTKSVRYTEFLSILNSARIRLLDEPVQIAELLGLERRVSFGGHASIDHSPGQHDDLIDATSGAAVLAATVRHGPHITPAMMAKSLQRAPERSNSGRGLGLPRFTGLLPRRRFRGF